MRTRGGLGPAARSVAMAVVVLTTVCTTRVDSQSSGRYVLKTGKVTLDFTAQPDQGYVVKPSQAPGEIGIASSVLGDVQGEVRQIGGLERDRGWIVENPDPTGRNAGTIARLRQRQGVQYVAPLFVCAGEPVAIIPEIVVRVVPGTNERQVQDLCRTMGCAVRKPLEFTTQEYLIRVVGPDAEAVFTALGRFAKVGWIEWAFPNTVSPMRLAGQFSGPTDPPVGGAGSAQEDPGLWGVIPNDPYFPCQWHLYNTGQFGHAPGGDINVLEAWRITTGDPNIIVAVIDTGVQLNHPDLMDNLVAGYDFMDKDDSPLPGSAGHGTWMAGIIAARGNNFVGVSGVTWNCKIMPIRSHGEQEKNIPQADFASAFRWAATHGADVLSNSWGGASAMPVIESALIDITAPGGIGRAGKGCVVVFCSHNGYGAVWYPARYPQVIAVGAVRDDGVVWDYSNRGPELDLVAPSGPYAPSEYQAIVTTNLVGPTGGSAAYGPSVHTSAACPQVAGVAALLLSIEPELTGEEVHHFLCRSAHDLGAPGRDDLSGWGRVDARAALDMVLAKRADLNDDWVVNDKDLALLTQALANKDLAADIAPAAKRDGVVDAKDRELLTRYLGTMIPQMPTPP